MKKNKIIMIFLSIQPMVNASSYSASYVDLSAGGANLRNIKSEQVILLNEEDETLFSVSGKKHNIPVFSMGGGYEWQLSQPLSISLGLEGYYRKLGTVNGIVHPLVNIAPDFDVLNFSYEAKSFNLMLESRIKWTTTSQWQPYILIGAGESWNKLKNYKETTPSGSTTAPMPMPFTSHRQNSFAYEAGLGVGYRFNSTGISLEYSYANLGKASLGVTPMQTTDNRITAGRLQTNNLGLRITQYFS